jgi:hypothetical protein
MTLVDKIKKINYRRLLLNISQELTKKYSDPIWIYYTYYYEDHCRDLGIQI